MRLRSSIYSGWVMHSRRIPRPHRFRYSVWWMLIDLDELGQLDRSLRVFSHNRLNLLSLYDSDYGHGGGPLRTYVEERLAEAKLSSAAARIELLTMPRIGGYAFNPLSIYFCRDVSDRIAAIIYEVHNTFGERHSYVIEVQEDPGGIVRQTASKAFYVSPFMDMSLAYDFCVTPPGETVRVEIKGAREGDVIIQAVLSGKRETLSTTNLLRHFIIRPLVTIKVIGAIHWEALRIWRKGIGVRPRDPHQAHSATIGFASTSAREHHV